jgi:hypothetical protein
MKDTLTLEVLCKYTARAYASLSAEQPAVLAVCCIAKECKAVRSMKSVTENAVFVSSGGTRKRSG